MLRDAANSKCRSPRSTEPPPQLLRRGAWRRATSRGDGPPGPRHTPVVAVEAGIIARLFNSKAGGITIYQFDPTTTYVVLLRASRTLRRWAGGRARRWRAAQVIGYVGTSGNARPNTPHLHFAIFVLDDDKRWWQGTPSIRSRSCNERFGPCVAAHPGAAGRFACAESHSGRSAAGRTVPRCRSQLRIRLESAAERRLHLRRSGTPTACSLPGTAGRVVTSLRTTPLLSIAAVLCAALGVSATTAAAALFSAVAVRTVPFPEGRSAGAGLARQHGIWRRAGVAVDPGAARSRRPRRRLRRVPRHGAQPRRRPARLRRRAPARRGRHARLFPALGLQPLHGRLLTAADFAADAPRAAVISARFWASRFGSDPGVVGRRCGPRRRCSPSSGWRRRDSTARSRATSSSSGCRLPQYLPAALLENRAGRSAWAIGRLAPGATMPRRRPSWRHIWRPGPRRSPLSIATAGFRDRADGRELAQRLHDRRGLLLGAVVLLLVIAALNVAGLLVARTIDRRRELAMRAALGASRGTLVADLVLEALVLTAIGGALGAAAAPALLDAVVAASPVTLPPYVRLQVDAVAVAAAVAAILLAGLGRGPGPRVAHWPGRAGRRAARRRTWLVRRRLGTSLGGGAGGRRSRAHPRAAGHRQPAAALVPDDERLGRRLPRRRCGARWR